MDKNSVTRADRMRSHLTQALAPILLEIIDESAKHAGHGGARTGGETHYYVKIISASFAGQNKVARHRAVYAALADEMTEGGIHALSMDLLAPQETGNAG